MSARVDEALGLLPIFRVLRPDERVRARSLFADVRLEPGAALALEPEAPRWLIVVDGQVALERGDSTLRLFAGDCVGEVELAAGRGGGGRVVARGPAHLVTLDRAGLDALFAAFPALAPRWLELLGRELKWRNDLLREAVLAHSEGLPPAQLELVLAGRRRRLAARRHGGTRGVAGRVLRALFATPGARPSFWMLVGVVSALAAARTVVAFILREGLQKHLFALIGGKVGHPIHVHHFNYGLGLVTLAGVLTLWPRTRRARRRLAFVLGFGLGLMVDEFALIWNLNPDYYQPQSRFVAGLVVIALAQVVYFGRAWITVGQRLAAWLTPARRGAP